MHSSKVGPGKDAFIRNIDQAEEAAGATQKAASDPGAPVETNRVATNVPKAEREDPISPHTALRPTAGDSKLGPTVSASMATDWSRLPPALRALSRMKKPPDELVAHGDRWLAADWPTKEDLMGWIG